MEVLVVDDEPVVRMMVRHVLEAEGFEVVLAACGEEAIAAWEERDLRLVVTDWLMPGLDGSQVCRAIRERPAGRYTYLIILTAQDAPESVVEGLASGADDYITKPFNPDELVLRVRSGARIVELECALAARISELEAANRRIRTLEGLLPMCSYCKSIRDDEGYWRSVEEYVEEHTSATFTHGVCSRCYQEHVAPQLERLKAAAAAARAPKAPPEA